MEKGNSRRVYLGFAESSWEFDGTGRLAKVFDGIMAWLQREPVVVKAAWPFGDTSAQLLEMDTEDKYENAINFAAELDKAGIRGTFYSLTSVAIKHRPVVEQLMQKHEIGYHGEVHFGFKGKPVEAQRERLETMVKDMRNLVGSQKLKAVTGFRAPTESWDPNTEKLLRGLGIRHHVADPASSEARVPFFSASEPNLSTEEAIVVLPRTQMDDLNYLGMKLDLDKASRYIVQDFDYLHEAGALGVLSVHSQNYGPEGLMTFLTPPYVKRLQEHRKDVWAASGEQIADWWRARERVKFISGKLLDGTFTFTVQAPGNVAGLTFMVMNPAQNRMPMSVRPTTTGPTPEVVKIDPFRTALVFNDPLPTGTYRYDLRF